MITSLTPLTKLFMVGTLVSALAWSGNLNYTLYLLVLSFLLASFTKIRGLAKPLLLLLPMAFGLAWSNAFLSRDFSVGLITFFKVYALLLSSSILALTTHPFDLSLSLAQQLRIPYHFALTVGLAYGMMRELLRAYRDFVEAVKARWLIRYEMEVLGLLPVLVTTSMAAVGRRVDTLANMLELKGFGSRERTYVRRIGFGTLDFAFLFATLLAVILPVSIGLL